MRAPIPRAHWSKAALFALLFGTGLHMAERCLAGFLAVSGQ